MVTRVRHLHIFETMKTMNVVERVMEVRGWIKSGRARELRILAGLSQAEAARSCEVTQGAILRWERGERMPRGNNALAYHRLLRRLANREANSLG